MADFTNTPILTEEFDEALVKAYEKYVNIKYKGVPVIAYALEKCAKYLKLGCLEHQAIYSLSLDLQDESLFPLGIDVEDSKHKYPSEKFLQALIFASEHHHKQVRKPSKAGEKIPYISHLIAVASMLLQNQCTEATAIAGLLHDVVEDIKVPLDLISLKFGQGVASIVKELTEDKNLDQTARKTRYAQSLNIMSPIALSVSMADKLDNLRDYATYSPDYATNSVRDFYRQLLPQYQIRLKDAGLYKKHKEMFAELVILHNQLWNESVCHKTSIIRWINGNLQVGDYILPWQSCAIDMSKYHELGEIYICSDQLPSSVKIKTLRLDGAIAKLLFEFLQEQ